MIDFISEMIRSLRLTRLRNKLIKQTEGVDINLNKPIVSKHEIAEAIRCTKLVMEYAELSQANLLKDDSIN